MIRASIPDQRLNQFDTQRRSVTITKLPKSLDKFSLPPKSRPTVLTSYCTWGSWGKKPPDVYIDVFFKCTPGRIDHGEFKNRDGNFHDDRNRKRQNGYPVSKQEVLISPRKYDNLRDIVQISTANLSIAT